MVLSPGEFNGTRAHYNIRTDPQLGLPSKAFEQRLRDEAQAQPKLPPPSGARRIKEITHYQGETVKREIFEPVLIGETAKANTKRHASNWWKWCPAHCVQLRSGAKGGLRTGECAHPLVRPSPPRQQHRERWAKSLLSLP